MKIKKKSLIQYTIMLGVALCLCVGGFIVFNSTTIKSSYQSRLYVPTSITKIDNTYFIMDCWQHRLLYSDSLNRPIEKWKVATDDITGGHTVASDGELYITEDTEGSRIVVLKKSGGKFKEVQTVDGITGRPHYSLYDMDNKRFYVIAATEGTIYVFKNNEGTLELDEKRVYEELQGSYIRSMTIMDGYLYLTAGSGAISQIDYKNSNMNIVESYQVPEELYNMNYLTKIQDYYYCTTNLTGEDLHSGIFRARTLEDFGTGNYENLYNEMEFEGTPYFISFFDDSYYITEVGEFGNNGIRSFQVDEDNQIYNVKKVFFYSDVIDESVNRKHEKMP